MQITGVIFCLKNTAPLHSSFLFYCLYDYCQLYPTQHSSSTLTLNFRQKKAPRLLALTLSKQLKYRRDIKA